MAKLPPRVLHLNSNPIQLALRLNFNSLDGHQRPNLVNPASELLKMNGCKVGLGGG